ncbi:MAG TPA: cytochrome C oxidase subunit IV family protein [Terriglobales bacterium]|nr:cytochrome C oxidase subunit IV family protein [Terriglobales bacterium]
MSEHVVPVRTYYVIWAVLMVFTAVTAGLSFYDLGRLSIVVALLIAGFKAGLVGLYFMHIKYSDPVNRVAAIAGVVFVAILLALTSADFFTRMWFFRAP